MSSLKKVKDYCEDDLLRALEDIKCGARTIHAASKKYKIPFTTLRERVEKVRTKLCKKYSEKDILEALCKIKNREMSAYSASKKYNVPKATLLHRIKHPEVQKHGAKKILSDSIETQLAEWIVLCARSGYPKTKIQILNTAASIAKLSPGNSFNNKQLTSGWFKSFSSRHPEIRKRTPELIGKASAGITFEALQQFFHVVESQFEEASRMDLLNKPQNWWNIDETGFEMNPTPRSVYAGKGAKTVHVVEKGKSKEMVTCTCTVWKW